MKKIQKVIIPAAGLGTRFLPVTKASPKEMLPIVDKPLIQYATEEAVEAGINEIIFILSDKKSSITEHFDKDHALENELRLREQNELLDILRNIIPPDVTCTYIKQSKPLGLGHAVSCAKRIVGDDPFAVLLPDDLIKCEGEGCLRQMVREYEKSRKAIIAVQKVSIEHSKRYGIIKPGKKDNGRVEVLGIVEKPDPKQAFSNLGVIGRYIFPASIMSILEMTPVGVGNEIQLTDAIATLVSQGMVEAYEFNGIRFDCGSKLGFLQANVEFGTEHEEVGFQFCHWLSRKFIE